MSRSSYFLLICSAIVAVVRSNESPYFERNLHNTIINESIPVGTVIGTLEANDPEKSDIRYGIVGTDFFSVDPVSGEVKLQKSLDRETNRSLTFAITVEDKVDGVWNNKVFENISIIVEDVNDNAPKFIGAPYEIFVPEDALVQSTIFQDILVEDDDEIGDLLEVSCENLIHSDACRKFAIINLNSSETYFHGAIVLKQKLNYNEKEVHEFNLTARDGLHQTTTSFKLGVLDVQNSPPVFEGSLNATVAEDAPIGLTILTIKARDGDRAATRSVIYELVTNPFDYFLLESNTGELRTAKALDRDIFNNSDSILTLTVKAREVANEVALNDENSVSTATIVIDITDVNDEPPKFNKKEYFVNLTENSSPGTAIPNLNMTITDSDVGDNSEFALRLEDISGAFSVEPSLARGSAPVVIRLANTTLDYENPNQRKFIVLVIAEETKTTVKLASTSTITVEVTDTNDNAPKFENTFYSATVNESALPGTVITTIVATDRDGDNFGKNSIVYEIVGDNVDRSPFNVDKKSGIITVALCAHPGTPPCLDYETNSTYLLTYKATDAEGRGLSSTVPLQIHLLDSNDNAPIFESSNYSTTINEEALKFESPFYVKAIDADKTTGVTYSIVDKRVDGIFGIDPFTGEIVVINNAGVIRDSETDSIVFNVTASDGIHSCETAVNVRILDINNNKPEFSLQIYQASVAEDSEIGKKILQVTAVDNDTGTNSHLKYRFEQEGFDDFSIDEETGQIKISSNLDFDRRSFYNITVIAADGGFPSLTGSSLIQIYVQNVNNKNPYFIPSLQHAEIPKDAVIGTKFYRMKAFDPDINGTDGVLNFKFIEPITAVDEFGNYIKDNHVFKNFFNITEDTGEVFVASELQRDIATVLTISVVVTDTSAEYEQQGKGTLVVTITDINDLPPVFVAPWTKEYPYYEINIQEQSPAHTVVGTFTASDDNSDIDHYAIEPESEYFYINETTGTVFTKNVIDYEKTPNLNFTVRAYDIGEPQLSTAANVIVSVVNINDMHPVFDQAEYFAVIKENSPKGTSVINVSAVDGDSGDFGKIKYSLVGDFANNFVIDEQTGEIKVSDPTVLDREKTSEIAVIVEATDLATSPMQRKSTQVPVRLKIEDINDNPPVFMQHQYASNIVETVPYSPPSPIVQLHAEDRDETSRLRYHIVNGNDEEAFYMESHSGTLYPKRSLLGLLKLFRLTVEVTDGKFSDRAQVDVNVLDVNQNKPVFKEPSSSNSSIQIPENVEVNYLVTKVYAEDSDPGENGRVTYHFRVGNNDTQITDEFSIDENNGELRTLILLDREKKPAHQLTIIAKDHGTQTIYETLLHLSVILKDIDDNKPVFLPKSDGSLDYKFSVYENNPANYLLGKVYAEDADEGENAKVFYYIIKGNEEGLFKLDRRDGSIYILDILDREKCDNYEFHVKATNNPNYNSAANEIIARNDPTVVRVLITVKDENDNAPRFERNVYYAGVDAKASVGKLIISLKANDIDEGINGNIEFEIQHSYLFKSGSNQRSGSVIPSPFSISNDGKVSTVNFVTEYNQDRFELEIIAREIAQPNRDTKTTLNVWVYESQQLARVVLSSSPDEVEYRVHRIVSELSDVTGNVIVVDDLRYHVNEAGQIRRDWSDMYMHMINSDTQTIVTIPEVLKIVDAKYDFLKNHYSEFAIENVLPAYIENPDEPFEPALAALVALTIVLFVGCASVIILCCCFRHWIVMQPLDVKCDMLIKKPIIDDLSTTENPLWIEQKLKLYEEQELTMQVFCESEANRLPVIPTFDRRESDETSAVDNTYATIQHPNRRNSINTILSMSPGDYATLGGSVLPLDKNSSHSQQMIEAALGFQGCTFQVPDGPADTTELLRARSELRMNKDGQPEFVSELR